MTSFRKIAAGQLREALPKKWVLVDDERTLNTISKPTAVLSQRTLEPAAIAPLSFVDITLALMILSEHTDPVAAEDALDDLLVEALTAIGTLSGLTWISATKVVHQDRYMGYEITTTATLQLGV
jgi:hypothetical protein